MLTSIYSAKTYSMAEQKQIEKDIRSIYAEEDYEAQLVDLINNINSISGMEEGFLFTPFEFNP